MKKKFNNVFNELSQNRLIILRCKKPFEYCCINTLMLVTTLKLNVLIIAVVEIRYAAVAASILSNLKKS